MNTEHLTITRRHLPHWQREGAVYFVTFRLADSLPKAKLNAWILQRDKWLTWNPKPWGPETAEEYERRFGEKIDRWLDAGYGSCALRRKDCRASVRACLLKFQNLRLRIQNGVIMPNHVHLLMEPLYDNDLSKLLKAIKGASARACNKILSRKGTFWMEESYDHIVRDREEYAHFVRYIRTNPVKARLREGEYCFLPQDRHSCLSSETSRQTGMSVLRF